KNLKGDFFMTYDFTIIGAGIVGLYVGLALVEEYKGANILILEKEDGVAHNQTGRNSGVVHSGIYYKPGSLKAKLTKKGNEQIVSFCKEHDIPYDVCGKLIIATNKNELGNLENLYQRGVENGLDVKKLDKQRIHQIEPYLNAIAGIY